MPHLAAETVIPLYLEATPEDTEVRLLTGLRRRCPGGSVTSGLVETLACLRRDLPTRFGRGYDDLPPDVLARLETARTPSLDRDDLLASLESAVDGLLAESDEVGELATKAGARLREFLGADS